MLSLLFLLLNSVPATAQSGAVPSTLLIIDSIVAPDDAALRPSDWEAMETITYNPNVWLRDSKRVPLKKLHQQRIESLQGQDDFNFILNHGSNVSHLARRYSGDSRILAMPGGLVFSSVFRTEVNRGVSYTFFRERTIHHLFKDQLQELKNLLITQNVRVVSLSYWPFEQFKKVGEDLKQTKNIVTRELIKSQLRTYRRLWKEWSSFISQQKETVFVISSGNDGNYLEASNDDTEIQKNMFRHPNVLYVAALNAGNGLELYSNYGKDAIQIAANGTYDAENRGTSFAAPRVSGTLAKSFSEHPELTAKEGIQNLFDDHTVQHQDLVGLVEGARALKDPEANTPTSLPIPLSEGRQVAKTLQSSLTKLVALNQTDLVKQIISKGGTFPITFYLQRGPDGKPTIRMDIDCRDIAEGN